MKKLISLFLALVMLMSCATVLAESTDKNATMTVGTPVSHYATDNEEAGATEAATPSVNTEIWLQVDAAGQIDVTVPLVLVFKTNIDGGTASSPAAYVMTNNSTADIAVTSIKVNPVDTDTEAQPMEFVAYNTVGDTVDQYGLKLSVEATEADAANHRAAHAAYDKDMFDFTEEADTADVMDGGLFQVFKGATTKITALMKTGPLSFTTLRKAGDTAADPSVLDTDKGVKIITITYTVGIDAQNAIGDDITDADEQFKAPAANGN